MQVVGRFVAAPQHGADQFAARNPLADPHIQSWVEMAVHRVEIILMPDDHHPSRVVRPSIDNLTITYRIDVRPSGIALDGIPVLASVPVARIIPSVLNISTM